MSKNKTPFFSFGAKGTINRSLTAQKRGSATLIRSKPLPLDHNTLEQQYQRWDYQDYVAWWHDLTQVQRESYRSAATRLRLTIFQYWLHDRLSTLPDLSGRWRLDSVAGGIATDSSLNSNNGTIFGASLVPGVIGNSFSFDGIDDWVDFGVHSEHTGPILAVEFWMFLQTIAQKYLVGKADNRGYPKDWRLWLTAQGQIQIFFGPGGADVVNHVCTIPPPLNQWTHVVWQRTGALSQFFINGLPAGSAPYSFTQGDYGETLKITRVDAHATRQYHGLLDNLIINNRVLTPSDILRHSLRRYPL